MAISFDRALGAYQSAIELRADRSEVLANNIANADTPGYKARDIDFKSLYQSRLGATGGDLKLATSDRQHVSGLLQPDAINGLKYRIPNQPAVDGNSVDLQMERAEFARNTLQYQAAYTFLNGRILGLKSAIRGD